MERVISQRWINDIMQVELNGHTPDKDRLGLPLALGCQLF